MLLGRKGLRAETDFLIFSVVIHLELADALFCFLSLARFPPFDSSSTEGTVIEHESFKGDITFNNIEFSYPSRPDVKVFNMKWRKIAYECL